MSDEYEYSVADTLVSTKLKSLFVSPDKCIRAALYRDEDGVIYVFTHLLANHGNGQDHNSTIVKSVDELRECLLPEVRHNLLTQENLEQLCQDCAVFFEQ